MSNLSMHVAVLIDTDDSWGRNVIESIASYARTSHWTLLICPRDEQRRLRLPKQWKGDGILVAMRDQGMVEDVRRANVPTIDVSIMRPNENWLGRVATDDQMRAMMAFEHLRDRGLQNFSCFTPSSGSYTQERARLFGCEVENAGFKYWPSSPSAPKNQRSWQDNFRFTREWLQKLPRPLGVFTSDPDKARLLAEICQLAGIQIPDEVAIISGGNDDFFCNVSWPPISGVELASHYIGYEACEMLIEVINTGQLPSQPKLIPPLRVISRHSTDIMATADDQLKSILRFIQGHANEGIRVKDILDAFPISRRTLEVRFRDLLGRSPAEEIRKVRLENARNLILETDLSMTAIASRCGFTDAVGVSRTIRKHFHVTPTELRRARQKKREG